MLKLPFCSIFLQTGRIACFGRAALRIALTPVCRPASKVNVRELLNKSVTKPLRETEVPTLSRLLDITWTYVLNVDGIRDHVSVALCISPWLFEEQRPRKPVSTFARGMSKMSSKITLVTGGHRGIGLGIVQALLQRSTTSTIIIASRRKEDAEQAIARLVDRGSKASLYPLVLDVTSDESIASAVAEIRERLGRVDGE